MAKNDDLIHFEMEHNFRAETFIIQSRIFYLGLPGEHLKLLLFILHLVGDNNDANPSINQLARYMGKDRRQIQRYLADMKELGLIMTKERYNDENTQTSNKFLIRDFSKLKPLFSLNDLKREDFKIDITLKSQEARQKQKKKGKPDNQYHDTGDTVSNTGILNEQLGHQSHSSNQYHDTSDTVLETSMTQVTSTPVSPRINTMVGMNGRTVEQNVNSQVGLAKTEVSASQDVDLLDELLIDVLNQFGVINTETGNELFKIAKEENATSEEMARALKEFLIYRQKLSESGEKVKNPFGFFVEKIRKFHKSDDLLSTLKIPEELQREMEKKKSRGLRRPQLGSKKTKSLSSSKYENFYL